MGDLEWTEGLDEWAGQGEAVIQAPGPSVPGKCCCCHHGSEKDKNCAGWALSAYGGRNAEVVVGFHGAGSCWLLAV
jgi:cytochrome c2